MSLVLLRISVGDSGRNRSPLSPQKIACGGRLAGHENLTDSEYELVFGESTARENFREERIVINLNLDPRLADNL